MIMPVIIAIAFILMGLVLLRYSIRSLASGEAETEDSGTLYLKKQPIQFSAFVVTQFVFGVFLVLGGLALAGAALFFW